MPRPRVLVIAGSDPSGGAGLEADQKVLATHGVYACTATTALTVQNTLGVEDVCVTDPEFVGRQIKAVLEDMGIRGIKLGMLASKQTIEVVARELQDIKSKGVDHVVLDPVMVSTSLHQLLPPEAVRDLRQRLLPVTTILTPNIPEAQLLLRDVGHEVADPASLEDLKKLAQSLHELGPRAVLLKGGHMPLTANYQRAASEEEKCVVVDVLFDGKEFQVMETKYLRSKNTHGTGCSLASAIAANLSKEKSILASVREAAHYVEAGIKTSEDIGKGNGPINHYHSLPLTPFARGRFLEYLLGRNDVATIWNQFLNHDFVKKLSDGSLQRRTFEKYLVQDYLYLIQFARCHALAAYKSRNIDSISKIYREPSSVREGNPYWKWVENYVAEDFVEAVKNGSCEVKNFPEEFRADEHRLDRDACPRSITSED
ncbi:MAG: hypothetical protein Q9160_000084 [Pyrenula sp. 1 TL-2023]